jgi:hypothetical protein
MLLSNNIHALCGKKPNSMIQSRARLVGNNRAAEVTGGATMKNNDRESMIERDTALRAIQGFQAHAVRALSIASDLAGLLEEADHRGKAIDVHRWHAILRRARFPDSPAAEKLQS